MSFLILETEQAVLSVWQAEHLASTFSHSPYNSPGGITKINMAHAQMEKPRHWVGGAEPLTQVLGFAEACGGQESPLEFHGIKNKHRVHCKCKELPFTM